MDMCNEFIERMGQFCRFYVTPASYNAFSFRGDSPLTPCRGSAPGLRWGLCPQTSIIGSHFALAMCPPNFHDPPSVGRLDKTLIWYKLKIYLESTPFPRLAKILPLRFFMEHFLRGLNGVDAPDETSE